MPAGLLEIQFCALDLRILFERPLQNTVERDRITRAREPKNRHPKNESRHGSCISSRLRWIGRSADDAKVWRPSAASNQHRARDCSIHLCAFFHCCVSFAGGCARSSACFSCRCFRRLEAKSSDSGELPQARASRASATLCR